jgi:hypothetical protein
MALTEYSAKALLALPSVKEGMTEEQGLLAWSRPFLIAEIRGHGVDVDVTRGAGALDADGNRALDVVRPSFGPLDEVTIQRLGNIGFTEYGVVRSIVRPVDIKDVPVLNPNDIRAMARNKFEMANDILIPAKTYGRHAAFFDPHGGVENIKDVLDAFPGDLVVAKPNGGMRSKGVHVGTKYEVARRLEGVTVPYVIEEKLDLAHPMPGVKGLDEGEQLRLDKANESGVNKELRVYYFGNGIWDGVGRIAKPGETDFRDDKWLQVDLDSIPPELITRGNDIINRIWGKIGTDEINIAIDWVFASSASEPAASWRIMELNAAEPQLVQVNQHEVVGKRQHRKLAVQIARIAVN